MDIEITAMRKVAEPKPNKSHDMIVANFDAVVGPLCLHNCALVKIYNKNGEVYKGLAAWPPYIVTGRGDRGVRVIDREFQKELRKAARDVYFALGGEE